MATEAFRRRDEPQVEGMMATETFRRNPHVRSSCLRRRMATEAFRRHDEPRMEGMMTTEAFRRHDKPERDFR